MPPENPSAQRWDANAYASSASFVPALGKPLLEMLAPKPGMRVLDIGCGDGTLSSALVAAGCIVVGIDASPEMVAAAKAKGIDARLMDAHRLSFDSEFDAAFSNAALHWMTQDPPGVVRGIARALVPGGRFVGELGGQGNIAAIQDALSRGLAKRGIDLHALMPKFFPSAQTYRTMLEGAGLRVHSIELFARPTPLPDGLGRWLEIFSTPALTAVPIGDRADLIAETEDAAAPKLRTEAGWFADYVRLRFAAEKAA